MPESPGSEGRRGAAPGTPFLGRPREEDPDTNPSKATLDFGPVAELVAGVGQEAAVQKDAARRADLLVRLGLLAWDLGDLPASRNAVEATGVHPLAAPLLVAHALAGPGADAALLEKAEATARQAPTAARPALLRDLGETWLYRAGDAARAARLLREAGPDPDAREVLPLALALSGDWAGVLAVLREGEPGPAVLLEAGHVAADRLGDAAGAVALYARVPAGGEAGGAALEHLIELATAARPPAGVDLVQLLRRKLEAFEAGASAERAVTQLLLALQLEKSGQLAEASALVAPLSGESGAVWGGRFALAMRRRLAVAAGAWPDAAAACRELAGLPARPPVVPPSRPPVLASGARAYLRRAAELYDARLDGSDTALVIYSDLLVSDPADPGLARAVERLRLQRGEFPALVAQLETSARQRPEARACLLRRAAAVAESRLVNLEAALRLRREAQGAQPGIDEASGHHDLIRLMRKRADRPGLAQAYRAAAAATGDDRTAAAYLCAAAGIELGSPAPSRDLEDILREAARRAPDDPTARLALAALLRRAARWRELAEVLEALAPLCADDGNRAAALRELGRIMAGKLGDPKGARAHLERALELAPADAGVLMALAELCGDVADWTSAVALRERAVLASTDPARVVLLLLEIGDIEERQRKNEEAARGAYERALARDEHSLEALRALAQLHRRAKRNGELVKVLRRELELTLEPQRRLSILLELARHADLVGDGAAAIEGYKAALALDPQSSAALAGLERLARREGRWEALAESLRAAPRTPKNLKSLGEALERMERWGELAEVRAAELDTSTAASVTGDRKEAARIAIGLAQLYEEKLRDTDKAATYYRRAAELDPTEPRAMRALGRLLEERGRWAELAQIFETELAAVPTGEAARGVALLARIGEIRRDRLDQPVEAAAAFEAMLGIEPRHPGALAALESLYGQLGRDGELLRILESRAVATEEAGQRAESFARIADIREKRGELDAALACYRESFLADPSNRNTFTSLERLCYKRERWPEAMELYDSAIALVESGRSRAYRLGDLYARKGQVLLQYLHQPAAAAGSYMRVLELDPDNDTALRFLESILVQESDWKNLIQVYEKRADLTADDERRIDTLRRAARVAASKLKEAAEAARLYERILAIDAEDAESLDALERHHERNRDWNKLISVLTLRLTTAPAGDAAVGLLTRIAQICEEGLRDEARAIEHYRRILDIAPGNKDALDALARIYESTEKWPEFVEITRRQIRITTDRNVKALLYFKCGSVMESKFGKEEEAIRYYDAAIKTSPSCLPAVHGLRDLHLRRKDWAKVIHTLELEVKLWQEDKERAGVFARIGQIYAEHLHEPDRALQYYESALAVDADCLPANRALFELHFARSDWAQAAPLSQALAQKAMREGDPAQRSEFYRKRGIVSWHVLDRRAAAESLVIALEIRPENLQALDELGRLARAEPEAYDFPATYRELEKIYRRRDDAAPHLARVLCAQAGIVERTGDLDAAEKLYHDALGLAPADFTVLSTLVDLHVSMRRWSHAADKIVKFIEGQAPPPPVRVAALLRLAEIHADGEMDPLRAASVLREVLRVEPNHQEALYRLAQELFVSGRYPEARQAIERCIAIAAAPGTLPSPEALARYYYYLGRILEAQGDMRQAGSQYRRAAEYDPGYAPTALALAKRLLQQGDRRGAEATLIEAAHIAIEHSGPRAAVPLQRGLARILLAAGERPAAIEAYRGILAVDPDGLETCDDQIALAEIYGMDDLSTAVAEAHGVLARDLRHIPAYRLLITLFARMGEPERALRVGGILELLGYADDSERAALAQARARQPFVPRRTTLPEDLRQSLLLPPAGRSVLHELYLALVEPIAQLYLLPPPGAGLVPYQALDDAGFKVAIADCVRLFGVEPEVYVGEEVHGGMIALLFPRPIVTLSRQLFARPDPERRFVLGRAFDSIRGQYAPLLRFGVGERREIAERLRSFLLPEAERSSTSLEFSRALPRKAQRTLERALAGPIVASRAGIPPTAEEGEAWLAALSMSQDRAGLLACDDFGAAARALTSLWGEELAVSPDGAVALGAIPGGAELVRYFLSDDYHRLRVALGEHAMPGLRTM